MPDSCVAPLKHWAGDGAGHVPMPGARDYETFRLALYAVDLFVPVVLLGQQAVWAPSPARGMPGFVGFWLTIAVQVAGWVIIALGATVLTGLVGRKIWTPQCRARVQTSCARSMPHCAELAIRRHDALQEIVRNSCIRMHSCVGK